MTKLLSLLKTNARLSNKELATLLGRAEDEIAHDISELERTGVIKGYTTIMDDDIVNKDSVSAYIELSVTPKAQVGYDEIAGYISQYEEVESVSLMSGGYDLAVTVRCKNIRDVSNFVAQRLATIDGVVSTSTHFFLQKYKENGILLADFERDERGLD